MKMRKWFWGLFFLMAGVGVIINQLGYFGSINLYTLIFTIILIPVMLVSIPRLHFSGILFPLAIIGILYAKPLGIEALTPWSILAAALFLSIGLSILFHRSSRYWYCRHSEHFDTIINENEEDENQVRVNVHLGSSIKYVNCKHFEKGVFECSLGALKVYFDNAKVSEKGAEIVLDISCSGVELYIPKEWNVVNQANATLGGIEEKNRNMISDGPVVKITGNVSLSGVEIIYI